MPGPDKPLWTLSRQVVGNLLPLLVSAPFLVVALREYPSKGLASPVLACLVLFPIVAWIATNFLGLSANLGLKKEMGRRLHLERPFSTEEKHFVGFARPGYQGLLDPHEDVGFLVVHDDRLEFFGSKVRVNLQKSDVKRVVFRPNPHAWVGLGRWVSVEGESDGKHVRLMVEPRERATLLGNRSLGSLLRKRLDKWSKG